MMTIILLKVATDKWLTYPCWPRFLCDMRVLTHADEYYCPCGGKITMHKGGSSSSVRARGATLLVTDVESTTVAGIACPVKTAPCIKLTAAPLSQALFKIGGIAALTTADLLMTNKGPVRVSKADGGPGHVKKGGNRGGPREPASEARSAAGSDKGDSPVLGTALQHPWQLKPGVYLCGRDLNKGKSLGIRNFVTCQFLLLISQSGGKPLPKPKTFGIHQGMTLAANEQEQKLVYAPNDSADVESVKSWVNGSTTWGTAVRALDITADLGGGTLDECLQRIIELGRNYHAQTTLRPLPFPSFGVPDKSQPTVSTDPLGQKCPPIVSHGLATTDQICVVPVGQPKEEVQYFKSYTSKEPPFNSNSFARSLIEAVRKEALTPGQTELGGYDPGTETSIPSFYFHPVRKWEPLEASSAAFIGADYEWAMNEQSGFPTVGGTFSALLGDYCFLGNQRKHGDHEELHNSKLWVTIRIPNLNKVGALAESDVSVNRGAEPSVRFPNHSKKKGQCVASPTEMEKRASKPRGSYVIVNSFDDLFPQTILQVSLDNSYPFGMGKTDSVSVLGTASLATTPDISLSVTLVLKQVSEDKIELRWSSRHNAFPDYDHYLSGKIISSYSAKAHRQSGPNFLNLGVQMVGSDPPQVTRMLEALPK